MRAYLRIGMGALALVVVNSGSASGSQDVGLDPQWVPWLGCWQLSEEQLDAREEPRGNIALIGQTSVCIAPAEQGVLLTAAVRDDVLVERQLIADGARRNIDTAECQGWEQSEWSRDGQRLFTEGEIQCDGAPMRRVHGVSLMPAPSSWVDIQLVEFDDRQQLEIRRYAPMPLSQITNLPGAPASLPLDPANLRQARRANTEELVLFDVIDASKTTDVRVVEALLIETEPDLNIDSTALIALDDAGIDHGVIDLLVALSYPDHFVVQQRSRGGSWSAGAPVGYGAFGRFYDPIWYGDLYPYYVTPFGSRGWSGGYYPYFIGASTSPFVVLPAGVVDPSSSSGRVYRTHGYTRVRPRSVDAAQQVGSRDSPSPGTRGRRVRTSGGSSSGGAATGGGYRGGGSGSGRRAVPRGK
jgi:uncharacterized membrane protein YgcG